MDSTPAKEMTAALEKEIEAFQQQNPQIVEALKVMNISFSEYVKALAAIKGGGSTSTNSFSE